MQQAVGTGELEEADLVDCQTYSSNCCIFDDGTHFLFTVEELAYERLLVERVTYVGAADVLKGSKGL